ncbi:MULTISPECIES: hypothetical protein, partial [unclassified Microcoleus]|uniref:hypothetical protein n=1 Tax=unclassified Microcoleus TaxID=2642155 RepID=UPI002FD00724
AGLFKLSAAFDVCWRTRPYSQLGIFCGAGRVYLSCLLPSMFVGEPAPTVNWGFFVGLGGFI